ncbi:hypothetical protein [Salinimicrobium soli]|uniref:hypothetical protein n=1 Tax=Salinimicrobium soli TaxID=1254399 RepID=UPI003AB0A8BA
MSDHKAKDVNIYMEVDTENLNQQNVETKVKFSDNNGDRQNGTPENFVSKVYRDKKVTWSGSAKNGSSDEVVITNITRKEDGGSEIWKKIDPKNDGTVEAKIKDKKVTGTENYDVHFTVNGVSYTVDPKLQMDLEHTA